MKKTISVFFAMIMCMVMCIPAFAVGAEESVPVMKMSSELLENGYIVELDRVETERDSDMQTEVTDGAQANAERVISDLISPKVMPISVEVYPIITVPEENGQVYVLTGLRRYQTLPGKAQAECFGLSEAATTSYINSINNTVALYNEQTGYTAEFIGWQLTCEIQMTATRPDYIELKPSSTSLTGTDPIREDIPPNYTTCTYTVTGWFKFTKPDLTQYQSYGFTGGFYFTYADVDKGGLYVSTGFNIND